MAFIDHRFFKEKLYKLTNRTFDLVSTIDHPYSSPPARLIDGHHNLKLLNESGLKPLICIWDVNRPDILSYRYELFFDSGIFASKDKEFFIFSDKIIYPLQKPKLINFPESRKRIQLILEKLQDISKEERLKRDRIFMENLDEIISIYTETICNVCNGTDFYGCLLKRIYELLGFCDLAIFFENYHYSFWGSPIIQKWIPYCIQETKNEEFGFLNLLNIGLFKKPYFRNVTFDVDSRLVDIGYIEKNIESILAGITNGAMTPSYEIFFWTLFLANIKHFGNDYGFFTRLNDILIRCDIDPHQERIQLTQHNKDCQNIIQFQSDRSFNCFMQNNDYIIKKNNPVKISRISSLPALYIHLGKSLGIMIRDILQKKIKYPQIIKMGELNIYNGKA